MAGRRPSKVTIIAPSHVHIGNPDLSGTYGRLYGTLGIALREPSLRIEAWPGRGECSCSRDDALRVYEKLAGQYDCRPNIRVLREIPAHVGLGSTTPLYLGIALAFEVLCKSNTSPNIPGLALALGRGTVSALGVYTFIYGGFLLDGGFRVGMKGRMIPPLIFRAEIPGSINLVLALPVRPAAKILRLKKRENEILERLPRMDPKMADRLSRIVLMGILPYAAEGDWREAGRWITEFNRLLGEYWASSQGGVYCCEEVEQIIDFHLESRALFAGQSSWGPTVYGAYPAGKVGEVASRLSKLIEEIGGGRVWVTRASNRGAVVSVKW